MKTTDLPLRLQEKIQPEPMSGCWLWTGATTAQGYGVIWRDSRVVKAHRWIYEILVGPASENLHHRCEVKGCVNPDHLAAMTYATHTRLHAWRETCGRGHSMADAYGGITSNRTCRECTRAYQRTHRAEINTRRRERYATDPVYREQILAPKRSTGEPK
jgi:hypothetical protein